LVIIMPPCNPHKHIISLPFRQLTSVMVHIPADKLNVAPGAMTITAIIGGTKTSSQNVTAQVLSPEYKTQDETFM
jgi:hypothetical protein